jgi:hypothetical protein
MTDESRDDSLAARLPRQSWGSGLRAAIDNHRHRNGPESPQPPRPRLGQVLIRNGYVSDEDINRALAEQARSGKLIGEILVEQGAVPRPIISRALEEQAGDDVERSDGLFSGLRSALGKNGPEPEV